MAELSLLSRSLSPVDSADLLFEPFSPHRPLAQLQQELPGNLPAQPVRETSRPGRHVGRLASDLHSPFLLLNSTLQSHSEHSSRSPAGAFPHWVPTFPGTTKILLSYSDFLLSVDVLSPLLTLTRPYLFLHSSQHQEIYYTKITQWAYFLRTQKHFLPGNP